MENSKQRYNPATAAIPILLHLTAKGMLKFMLPAIRRTSQKVKYKKSGNTVTFSAYGISYKVVYKANSKVLGFQQSGKSAVETYASILVKVQRNFMENKTNSTVPMNFKARSNT